MEDRLPRKLAAILYADVAGYSRLTGDDEDATHRRLRDYLDLIAKTIEDHHGQVMHYAGDAVLARFDAVVDALSSAVSIQDELKNRNADLPDERKVQFRIGVNLGDVIEDRGDIYGDGVNVAARLESLADAGGICISESVRTAIGKKLDLGYEFMGEQQVKNIEEPVRAYRVLSKSEKTEMDSAPGGTTVPELPEKPSIAVLPFENMSADPEQEFFADGIAEDLLTKLTNILGLFVIARNSSFRYKGKAVDVRQVAEELGVRYVLEGSVRKAGNRVRVTAQLIEAATGSHLWAEAYDRDLTDIFAVQDEITVNVVKALQVTLLEGEQARIWHRSTDNLEAWSCLTRATACYSDFAMEENRAGIELLERAVELDPDYASAWARLGWLLGHKVRFLWTDEPTGVMARVAECAHKALALDENLAEAHIPLGFYHLLNGDFDQAVAAVERGVALGPNNAHVVAFLAFNLNWVGRPEEALAWIEKAMRFSPFYPAWFVNVKAHALRLLGRSDEAAEAYRAIISKTPAYLPSRIGLTVCYAEMGCKADAQESARKLLELVPKFSIERYIHTPGYKDRALTEHTAQALREAGLPE